MANILPILPDFGGNPFLGTGTPSAPSGGINWPSLPSIDIWAPIKTGADKLGDIVSNPIGEGAKAILPSGTGNIVSCLMSPTSCLLRFVLLILGLICVAGAIYLYKPTSEIVAAPARAARAAVAGAAVA